MCLKSRTSTSEPAPQPRASTARMRLMLVAVRWQQDLQRVPMLHPHLQEQWHMGGSKHPRAEGLVRAVPVLLFQRRRVAAKERTPHLQVATLCADCFLHSAQSQRTNVARHASLNSVHENSLSLAINHIANPELHSMMGATPYASLWTCVDDSARMDGCLTLIRIL